MSYPKFKSLHLLLDASPFFWLLFLAVNLSSLPALAVPKPSTSPLEVSANIEPANEKCPTEEERKTLFREFVNRNLPEFTLGSDGLGPSSQDIQLSWSVTDLKTGRVIDRGEMAGLSEIIPQKFGEGMLSKQQRSNQQGPACSSPDLSSFQAYSDGKENAGQRKKTDLEGDPVSTSSRTQAQTGKTLRVRPPPLQDDPLQGNPKPRPPIDDDPLNLIKPARPNDIKRCCVHAQAPWGQAGGDANWFWHQHNWDWSTVDCACQIDCLIRFNVTTNKSEYYNCTYRVPVVLNQTPQNLSVLLNQQKCNAFAGVTIRHGESNRCCWSEWEALKDLILSNPDYLHACFLPLQCEGAGNAAAWCTKQLPEAVAIAQNHCRTNQEPDNPSYLYQVIVNRVTNWVRFGGKRCTFQQPAGDAAIWNARHVVMFRMSENGYAVCKLESRNGRLIWVDEVNYCNKPKHQLNMTGNPNRSKELLCSTGNTP